MSWVTPVTSSSMPASRTELPESCWTLVVCDPAVGRLVFPFVRESSLPIAGFSTPVRRFVRARRDRIGRPKTVARKRSGNESGDSRGWFGHTDFRRNAPEAKAHDRDRGKTDPVAHPQDVLGARHQRFHYLLRLQGLRDQGVLRQLFPAHVRRDV